jgi:hypothetical protein
MRGQSLTVFDNKLFGIIFVSNRDKVKENVEIRNNLMVIKGDYNNRTCDRKGK